jgi:hypothetical protein
MSAPFLTTLSKVDVRRSDVEKFGYMAMLAFTVCGSFWLEIRFENKRSTSLEARTLEHPSNQHPLLNLGCLRNRSRTLVL